MRPPVQLWLCTQPTDMRRSYDGLAAMVRRQLGHNPLSGHGFLFINRRRTQLKCLYFQAGGYCVWGKRLERGRFAALSPTAGKAIALHPASRTEELTPRRWKALFAGAPLRSDIDG